MNKAENYQTLRLLSFPLQYTTATPVLLLVSDHIHRYQLQGRNIQNQKRTHLITCNALPPPPRPSENYSYGFVSAFIFCTKNARNDPFLYKKIPDPEN